MSDTVLYEVSDGIATVTLNRPRQLNAITAELAHAAIDALGRAAADPEVRAVILTGAGRGFCAGGDRDGMREWRHDRRFGDQVTEVRAIMRAAEVLYRLPKVTIAAVNGACAGAGFSWACAADLRYAAESAVFTTAFLTAAQTGDFGGTWTAQRLLGVAKARELFLLGDRIDAREAARIGLVTDVVADGELPMHVRAVAARVARLAPLAVEGMKANLNDALELGLTELCDREAERTISNAATEDAREAGVALTEGRPPRFVGR